MISITGDPIWAERCEDVAFNSLPAAFTSDMKCLRYLTAPNMPQSDHTNKAPGIQNGGDMLGMNPHGHRCCQHNAGHGWPYFNHHLWYATAGDGLAAYLYSPCTVTAKVAGGVEVTIEEQTQLPVRGSDRVRRQASQASEVPALPAHPELVREPDAVGQPRRSPTRSCKPGRSICIDREWKPNDQVLLQLPMPIRVKTWTGNRDTVSVSRGPLTYSLLIKEKYTQYAGTDEWPAYDIFPDSPWNYGLTVDPAKPTNSLKAETAEWPANDRPFTLKAPVRIVAKARRIPAWTLDRRGLVNEVAPGPVKSTRADRIGDPDPDGGGPAADRGVPANRQRERQGLAATAEAEVRRERLPLLGRRHRRCPVRRRGAEELERSRPRPLHLVAAEGRRRVGAIRLRQAEGGLVGRGLLVRRHALEGWLQAAEELAGALQGRQRLEAGARSRPATRWLATRSAR